MSSRNRALQALQALPTRVDALADRIIAAVREHDRKHKVWNQTHNRIDEES